MKFTLGFSPCPNDTYIFDALVNKKIDTEGIEFQPVLEDIQTLNEWAKEGKLDITKLSFPALFENVGRYELLDAGAALGKGVGPLLISRTMVQVPDIEHSTIAIPGINTTANLLLTFAFPMARNRIPMLFSEIEDAVQMGKVDLGVIIHENRFTYHLKNLIKVCDLGEIWEQRQQVPIPLGCIAARTALQEPMRQKINSLIRRSIEFAFEKYPEITDYTRQHAQAMDEQVMRRHIELYVNNFSLDLGEEGKAAIRQLAAVYKQVHSEQGVAHGH